MGSDGGDTGGGGFVVQSVRHGGHILDIVQPGGHDGVGHGRRQPLEKEALEQDTFCFFIWKESSHVLQQVRGSAVAEAGVVQKGVSLLPLRFAVVLAQVLLQPFVGILVFKIDRQQERAARERNGVGKFSNYVVTLDP